MQASDTDIEQLMNIVLETMLDVHPSFLGHDDPPAPSGRTLSAVIHITGAVDGAVVLHVTEPFARVAAARMFGIDPEAAGPTDQQDALGEICNVVGGNIKSLLPEPCRLSLPTVIDGADYSFRIPGSSKTGQFSLEAAGQPLLIRLWRKDVEAASRSAAA
jgi:chemotaxis protein CheX